MAGHISVEKLSFLGLSWAPSVVPDVIVHCYSVHRSWDKEVGRWQIWHIESMVI